MKKNKKFLLYICMTFLLFYSSIVSASVNGKSKIEIIQHEVALEVPETVFFDNNGDKHNLLEYENKVVLVYFWATWCTNCKIELKKLNLLQKNYRKKPLRIVAISEDFKGSNVVSSFYQKNEIDYLNLFIDHKNLVFNDLNIIGIPTSLLINRDGKEILRVTGAIDWNEDQYKYLIDKELLNALTDKTDNAKPNNIYIENKIDENKIDKSFKKGT